MKRSVVTVLICLVGCASQDARSAGDLSMQTTQAVLALQSDITKLLDAQVDIDVAGVRGGDKQITYGAGDVWLARIVAVSALFFWPLFWYLGKRAERRKLNGRDSTPVADGRHPHDRC